MYLEKLVKHNVEFKSDSYHFYVQFYPLKVQPMCNNDQILLLDVPKNLTKLLEPFLSH